jgi:hypothetical protein
MAVSSTDDPATVREEVRARMQTALDDLALAARAGRS